MTQLNTPTTGELAAAISNAVVSVFRAHTGKGPERSRTILDDVMAVTVLRGGFSASEKTLQEHGRAEVVENARTALQEIMKADLIAAVEAITGRTVDTFVSAIEQDAEVQAQIFLFRPEHE